MSKHVTEIDRPL